MKKIFLVFFIIVFLFINAFGQNPSVQQPADFPDDTAFYKDAERWFKAWQLVSRDVFKINSLKPVEFVFFDEKYVYSTSKITIPVGEIVTGPKLLGKKFVWKRALHNDSITLPDKRIVPIGLMSFASPVGDDKDSAFFIMPLSTFWKKSGVDSPELGFHNLITGVFLHEFSHSQQVDNFGKKVTEYEKANSFGTKFSDDMIQELFSKDSAYSESFKQETDTFFEAVKAKEPSVKALLINKGLNLMKARHLQYFKGNYENLPEIDEIFLTMEGLGQFAMYAWLIHTKGGNIASEKAFIGVRRGGTWWSQDEGFALFLLFADYEKPKKWSQHFFGTQTSSVVKLLQDNLKKQ